MKKTNENAITLIALIITIIILLILSGVTISNLIQTGLVSNVLKAKDETKINEYITEIELKKLEVKLEQKNPEQEILLTDLKNVFETDLKWVNEIKIIIDNDIEKIELITKEGYIFYITTTNTEYKGKGDIIDTSALRENDKLKLEITSSTNSGKNVKIVDMTGKNYYKIQYKIGSNENDWNEIKSGEEVEVPFNQIIYARLYYGNNYGIIYKLNITDTKPILEITKSEYNNITRKTDLAFSDMFEITWGSAGVGESYYKVKGTLKFNNTKISYDANQIMNVSELELGTYEVTCAIVEPGQSAENNVSDEKSIKIIVTNLAKTTISKLDFSEQEAYAIYSEYDMAYFRDLVNDGNYNINAKVMKDIDLLNVCSAQVGDWKPIGAYQTLESSTDNIVEKSYNGTFDGNDKKITNLYINNLKQRRQGLISVTNKDAYVKNVIIYGNINTYNRCAGIVRN